MVHWICPINPEEHTWPATVLNRARNGTGCPDCNLPGTSAQEIRLAAELGTVLDVDFDRHTIRTAKRMERVDIYVPSLSLILEFDGSYWHESTEERDNEKTRSLRT
ncbi:zinc-ribbon domain-containing protein, partial [Klebsiella pneumoniae]|uniref:zinc-ribbon domain-containing protein n=1 Tax=Klebsiella pneumoniae TaxID=573 RepID=UPI0034D158FB